MKTFTLKLNDQKIWPQPEEGAEEPSGPVLEHTVQQDDSTVKVNVKVAGNIWWISSVTVDDQKFNAYYFPDAKLYCGPEKVKERLNKGKDIESACKKENVEWVVRIGDSCYFYHS
ncbi:MAG: hypothetical protein R6U19_00230 [Bacteroidales bacterium]